MRTTAVAHEHLVGRCFVIRTVAELTTISDRDDSSDQHDEGN